MSVSHDASVEELRLESERTRAALASTVGDLREKVNDAAGELKARVSPAHIKEEFKDYVRESRDDLVQSFERKVRDNPLQAVAVGAALAYPLWGALRAIPAPILLVGAGIWLAGKGGKASLNQAQAKAADLVEAATAKASGWTASAQTAAGQSIKGMTDPVADASAAVAAGITSLGDKARTTAHDVRESVAGMGQATLDSVSGTATAVTEAASEAVSAVAGRARAIGEQSRNGFADLVDRNPLLVAGVGLAIGAFIAASLPPSKAENRLFGESSDDLKAKAGELAAQGIGQAKEFATGIVGDVAAAAAHEGLDADGVRRAAKELTDNVKAVADRGLQTALGGETSTPSKDSLQPYKG